MTTISGFSKTEVYNELENNLLKTHETDMKKAGMICNFCVELALTKNELSKWITFCIDFYTKYILSDSHYVNDLFQSSCKSLLCFDKKSLDIKAKDMSFRKYVCNIAILLALEKKVDHEISIWKSYQQKLLKCNPDLIKEYISEYVYNDKIFLKFANLYPILDGIITDEAHRRLCVLLYSIRTKEHNITRYLLSEIFNEVPKQNANAKIDYKVSFLNNTGFKYLENHQCSDILWVLWKGVLNFGKKYLPRFYDMLNDLFKLSQIGYCRKNKKLRGLILISILERIICEDFIINKGEDCDHQKKDIINKARKQIHGLFEEQLHMHEKNKRKSKNKLRTENVNANDDDFNEIHYSGSDQLSTHSSFDSVSSYSNYSSSTLSKQSAYSFKSGQSRHCKKKGKGRQQRQQKQQGKRSKKEDAKCEDELLPDYLNILTFRK